MDGHGLGSGVVNNWTVGITLYLNDVKAPGRGYLRVAGYA